MQSSAGEPGTDGEFAVSEDPHGCTDAQTFGQGTEDFPDAPRRGLETVQDRAIADAEFCPTGLALEIPDVFLAASLAPRLRAAQVPV